MYVEFKKDHFSGLVKGTITSLDNESGKRLISEGFCKEVSKDVYDEYIKEIEDSKKAAAKASQEAEEKRLAKLKAEEEEIEREVLEELQKEETEKKLKALAEEKELADKKAKDEAEMAKKREEQEIIDEKRRKDHLREKIRSQAMDQLARGENPFEKLTPPESEEEKAERLQEEKVKALKALKVGDLKAKCEELELPEEEWVGLKKDELVEYLSDK